MKRIGMVSVLIVLFLTPILLGSKGGSSVAIGHSPVVKQTQKGNDKQLKNEPPPDYVPYDKAPEVVRQVEPRYPNLALKAGLEGTVWVKVWVDEQGKIVQAAIQKSDAEIFNQSAIDAAMQWTIRPAMSKGKPISTWVSIPFRFKIQGYPTETRTEGSLGRTILGDRPGMGWQEMLLIISIVGFFLLLRLVLTIVAVIDIVKSQFQDANDKIVWTVVAVLFPIFGPILYFVLAKKQKVSIL